MDESEFAERLASIDSLGPRQSAQVAEACAIAYYQWQTDFPVIDTLLTDDAPQFKLLTKKMGLCWVHDGRHYKKLTPIVPAHQNSLKEFRGKYWAYYARLLSYQREPSLEKKAEFQQRKNYSHFYLTRFDYSFSEIKFDKLFRARRTLEDL